MEAFHAFVYIHVIYVFLPFIFNGVTTLYEKQIMQNDL